MQKKGVRLILIKEFDNFADKEKMLDVVIKSIKRAGLSLPKKKPKINLREVRKFSELNMVKEAAINNGGELLSEMYLGVDTKLDFICKNKHYFNLSPDHLLRLGVWCGHKKCRGERISKSSEWKRDKIIEKMKVYCGQIGYKYVGWKTAYRPDGRFEPLFIMNCGKGHEDTTTRSYLIKNKPKCKTCNNELKTKISELSIAELKAHAKKHGGKCSADRNRGYSIKLPWKCKNGHEWLDTPWQIVANNKWCEDC